MKRSERGFAIPKGRVFVISDLHMGDGSPKDNLRRGNREELLNRFLDHVDRHNGELVIAGDLFEFLRYPVDRVIARRWQLLDRFADIGAVFIPGNHDQKVWPLAAEDPPPHPFFSRVSDSFQRTIGGKTFKFMHGHEVDPFVRASLQRLSRIMGAVGYRFEFMRGPTIISHDTVSNLVLEIGEQVLRFFTWLTHGMDSTLEDYCCLVPIGRLPVMTRHVRMHKMLTRYYRDRDNGSYDVAIVGHTHKAGTFGDWYFNCGSWTGRTNNFLQIDPDGQVQIFDWDRNGPRPNQTVLGM